MEVVPLNLARRGGPGGPGAGAVGIPFNKRNVEEWSRLDRLTGMMETAKIETDHWSASSNSAKHKYGKMVDSRERNNPDGSLQQRQRKQMEVFQSQVAGGSMQVIRTQTVTSSSSSSRWSPGLQQGFEDLKLPINSLDLSSQKTKGSVGRSGSIGSRRPPSRPRSLIGQSGTSLFNDTSRLCQQLHDEATSSMFKGFSDFSTSFNGLDSPSDKEGSGVVITEITSSDGTSSRSNLSRQKSCSNENVAAEEDEENLLRRTSKVRRSLQFPKQERNDWDGEWTAGKSLKERAQEIENLLRRGSSTTTTMSQDSDKSSVSSEKTKPAKRDSFVTVETLKEVRDRLKRTSEADDDGIVTEKDDSSPSSRVKSFVYGMEAMMNGRQINGTGSLESRSSCKSTTNGTRTAEWYRRRKSYGFEQVDESEKFDKFNKKHIESSTDSGICQSSETVSTPTWIKILADKKQEGYARPPAATIVRLGPRTPSTEGSIETPTVIPIVGEDKQDKRRPLFRRYTDDSLPCEAVWNRKSPLPIQRNTEVRESLKSSLRSAKNPWISQLRGTKLVDRKWISDDHDSEENEQANEDFDKTEDEIAKDDDMKITDFENGNQKKQKKVEFCKTEVHFAAESGKFNIVETDGKPPPNDIFKRRRRSSGPAVQKNTSGLPEIKFGDSAYEKQLLTNQEKPETISDKIEAELQELSRIVIESLPQSSNTNETGLKTTNLPKLYDVEEEGLDLESQQPRSILKNFRRSYLLGEAEEKVEERSPVDTSKPPVWKSTVILRNKRFEDIRRRHSGEGKLYSSDGESELQMRFRNLKKAESERKWWATSETPSEPTQFELKRRSLPDDILSLGPRTTISRAEMPTLSVAERIKQVEDFRSNYSSKINFRSGEMTVVQNGSESNLAEAEEGLSKRTTGEGLEGGLWSDRGSHLSYDDRRTSNPSVMRFSTNNKDKTDSQQYQTTRILINLKSDGEAPAKATPKTYPHASWTAGMKKDFSRHCADLKSTSLVKQTLNSQETEKIPKSSKPIHEIINKFDSLSLPKKNSKEKRRKTMPINYKAPKVYTHADLEEELKNFTENLDKDFKDIYEEEIENLQRKTKKQTEKRRPLSDCFKINTKTDKSSSSSRGHDSGEDSDVLADEEVRSYMSTGHGGTDSETDEPGSWSSRKSFEDIKERFKKLEVNGHSGVKEEIIAIKSVPTNAKAFPSQKVESQGSIGQPKIASIALRYEDDPLFGKSSYKSTVPISRPAKEVSDVWERNSNSSSYSDRPRERASYLNGPSLSEKYSKALHRSSNSSLENVSLSNIEKITKIIPVERPEERKKEEKFRYVGRSSAKLGVRKESTEGFSKGFLESYDKTYRSKISPSKDETDSLILEELTRAADQIMIAVNGYTDEDSHLASSEDDDKSRRVIRRDKMGNLGTISEGKRVTKTEVRRTTTVNALKRTGNQSSASSLESLPKESVRRQAVKPACPRLKKEAAKPLSSRATRLLQRANSREAMAQPSSSEDIPSIPSYAELAKKRSVRRQRSAAGKEREEKDKDKDKDKEKEKEKICSRVKSKTKEGSESRIRERKAVAKEVSKESSVSRSRVSNQPTERTRTSSRRVVEKTECEVRKKRTQLYNSEEQATIPLHKKRSSRLSSRAESTKQKQAV